MATNEDELRRAAAREAGLKTAGLFVLLARAGGRTTFTQEEYEEARSRHGGSNVAIHVEVLRTLGQPDEIQLTLVNKPPANAELVS
jgi:hypothetical protein